MASVATAAEGSFSPLTVIHASCGFDWARPAFMNCDHYAPCDDFRCGSRRTDQLPAISIIGGKRGAAPRCLVRVGGILDDGFQTLHRLWQSF